MTERPILFSGAMVRALLAGTKTQTRRAVKPQPEAEHVGEPYWFIGGYRAWQHRGTTDVLRQGGNPIYCPFGRPGDKLWVRETFSGPWCMEAQDGFAAAPPSKWGRESRIWYWADGEPSYGDWTRPRPSIHMPRWASRITLEVTEVRVERLQDISEADCIAEGLEKTNYGFWSLYGQADVDGTYSPRSSYRALWESINGPGSWAANPWVWAVSFKVVKGGGL